jgi:hypothetical protein
MKKHLIIYILLLLPLSLMAKDKLHGYDTNFSYSLKNFVDTIPIEFEKGQVYVTVQMNGRPYRFCVDTGSSQGAVFRGTQLGSWTELGNVVTHDATGLTDTVRVIGMPPFRLGHLEVSGYVASVFNRTYSKSRYDAILGFDLINKGLCCKIDTRNKWMILTDRRDFFDGEPGHTVGYKLKWFVPYLLVSPFKRHVDEVRFDTGARELYSMNKQSFDEHAYKSKNVESQVEGRAQGSFAIGTLGAERPDEVAFLHLDRLRWGEFAFLDVRAITTQGASRVGAGILNYGTVTINGFRRTIRFEAFDGADSVVVANKALTVAFVPYENRAAVGIIQPDCDAYRAGMRQGDIIVAINGKEVRDFQAFIDYPFVDDRYYTFYMIDREGKTKTVISKR